MEKGVLQLVKLQAEKLQPSTPTQQSKSEINQNAKFESERNLCNLVYSELIKITDDVKREEKKSAIISIIYILTL